MAYVDRLEDECVNDPNRIAWETSRQRWLDLYTGNHFATGSTFPAVPSTGREPEEVAIARTTPTLVRIVYNRVMNAILAHLAGQISNEPKIVFNARESGEPPIYYLNGYVQNPFVQQLAMRAGATDQRVTELQGIYGGALPGQMEEVPDEQAISLPGGIADAGASYTESGNGDGMQPGSSESAAPNPQAQPVATRQAPMHASVANAAQQVGLSIPLEEPFVTQIKQMIDQGRVLSMQARMQGLPVPQDIVPPEALVEVTDQTTAQFTQTVYDALWEQCGGVEAVNENILNKKIIGWQPTLFESDRAKIDCQESPITLTNVESAQVYYDPMTSSYRKGQYAILREPVSVEEGCAKYPELADVIRNKALAGTLSTRLSRNDNGSRLAHIEFGRDMVVVRTVWIRAWPYPMDPDEAMACGAVQMGQVPDESAIAQRPPVPTDTGAGAAESGGSGSEGLGGSTPGPEVDGSNGQPNNGISGIGMGNEQGMGVQPIPTRSAFIHSDTGEEVTPDHPNWPIVYAIREIRDIEGEKVFDRRCQLPDIPLPNNVNIPVPFSPHGIGEPDRLDGLQMAINRVLSDLLTFHRYNAYPPELMHQAISDALSPKLRRQRSQPNSMVVVPRDIADQVGGDLSKCVQFLQMPQMGPDAWKLLEFLVEAIDKEANNSEVSQGIAPSGSSGAWVANLQAAAAQITQVTSMSTEAWLKKLVRLFVHFITHDMTVSDIQKYTSKYPPPILQAFHARQKQLYLDVSVEIQSGSAAAKQGQTNAMLQARQAGIMVSDPTILDRMNVDADDELKRQGDYNQKRVETGAVEMMPQEQGQGEKKQPPQGEAA